MGESIQVLISYDVYISYDLYPQKLLGELEDLGYGPDIISQKEGEGTVR